MVLALTAVTCAFGCDDKKQSPPIEPPAPPPPAGSYDGIGPDSREAVARFRTPESVGIPIEDWRIVYVDANAGDGGDGSEENPLRDIAAVDQDAERGTLVFLAPGLQIHPSRTTQFEINALIPIAQSLRDPLGDRQLGGSFTAKFRF